MEPLTLPRSRRITRRSEFLRVQREGRSAAGRFLVVRAMPNGHGRRRLGVTVSSRVGNAVERNRVKRWLRDIFRRLRGALPEGVDVVVIARRGSPEAGLHRLEEEFLSAASRLRRQLPGREPSLGPGGPP